MSTAVHTLARRRPGLVLLALLYAGVAALTAVAGRSPLLLLAGLLPVAAVAVRIAVVLRRPAGPGPAAPHRPTS